MDREHQDLQRYFQHAAAHDAEQGGHGLGIRSTREVADYFGVTLGTARKRLWQAVDAGVLEAFDAGASGHSGNAVMWALSASEAHK